jgi:hypothetical protein
MLGRGSIAIAKAADLGGSPLFALFAQRPLSARS